MVIDMHADLQATSTALHLGRDLQIRILENQG